VTRAVLSLGSNLGDRLGHLRTARDMFGASVLVASGIYETPPWGDTEQPAYLNAVLLAADPTATPYDWLTRARAAEQAAGRVRDPRRPLGPRTLDVDVVAVWTDDDRPVVSDDPELTLPHPRAHLRAFVLRPWIDIQPYGHLPGHGWLTDLLTTGPAAAEVPELSPRPDLTLESTA
jgi:2-amino-4-hydroxy-6-hydroxymethyldihydropteridine diphosphokinase